MSPEEMVRQIAVLGRQVWMATLVGHPAPIIQDLHTRMQAPQPGDLVMELSTFHRGDWSESAVGRLQRVTSEPAYTAEQWAEGGDERPIPHEEVTYIESLLTGAVSRWVNADFTALPDGSEGWPR